MPMPPIKITVLLKKLEVSSVINNFFKDTSDKEFKKPKKLNLF